jgi:hypothetical protein
MKNESGTTIEIDLNKFFKSIGSSVLPAYPGLRVIKTAQLKFRLILFSSKNTKATFFLIAF